MHRTRTQENSRRYTLTRGESTEQLFGEPVYWEHKNSGIMRRICCQLVHASYWIIPDIAPLRGHRSLFNHTIGVCQMSQPALFMGLLPGFESFWSLHLATPKPLWPNDWSFRRLPGTGDWNSAPSQCWQGASYGAQLLVISSSISVGHENRLLLLVLEKHMQ